MKVLIIEDEKHASDRLIRLLAAVEPSFAVTGVLESVESSVNWFLANPRPDLIFMDVQLEDGLCFEIFDTIALETPVIFTTAYNEYTLRAFKVNSVDYLLKPLTIEELRRALEKYTTFRSQLGQCGTDGGLIQQLIPKAKERFLVRIGDHIRSVADFFHSLFFIRDHLRFCQCEPSKRTILWIIHLTESIHDPFHRIFRINRNCIVHLML